LADSPVSRPGIGLVNVGIPGVFMQKEKQEIVILDYDFQGNQESFLAKMKHAEIWFITPAMQPSCLFHKVLIETPVTGLHLFGVFTSEGFRMSNRVITPLDFPDIERDQSSRSITFWTEKKRRAQPINEVFMQDLMSRTRMTLFTVIDQPGLGFFKTRFESTPPPPAFIPQHVKPGEYIATSGV